MTAATRDARSAAALVARDGEDMTHTSVYGVATSCRCVVVQVTSPVLRDGQISVDENQYRGLIELTALASDPQSGDRLATADGTEYLIDGPPNRNGALWMFALRRLDD